MGRLVDRLRTRSAQTKPANRVDAWLNRAAQASQVLLVLLGIFGYFYTVLPLYQKALLDEEIAQKSLELKEQEKRVAGLNREIAEKQVALSAAQSAIKSANLAAQNAQEEAQENYLRLRRELTLSILRKYVDCPVRFSGTILPAGSDLLACIAPTTESTKLSLESLRPRDSELLIATLKAEIVTAQAKYEQSAREFQSKMKAAQTDLATIEKEVAAWKAGPEKAAVKPQNYYTDTAALNVRLWNAQLVPSKIRLEADGEFRKTLSEIALSAYRRFHEKASP